MYHFSSYYVSHEWWAGHGHELQYLKLQFIFLSIYLFVLCVYFNSTGMYIQRYAIVMYRNIWTLDGKRW